MSNELLTDKTAVIYGGGGAIGGAVARTFAREGATVHLAGRTLGPLQAVAADIAAAGGTAHVAVVDAFDEAAVDAHAESVGAFDVSFNLVQRGDVQGTPIVDLTVAQFMTAFDDGVKSAFLTARAAARHMIPQGSGVILHLTSGSSRGAAPMMGNTGPLDGATDALLRYLAAELGPHGIRAVGIHTAAVAETLTREKLAAVNPAMDVDPQQVLAMIAQRTMLGRAPAVQQVADTAAFLASDRASAITSQMVNATCGLVAG
jgi:NAD(P)-dependent dehydrogenase (short-subunit alcohol dehydrogenase family)